MGCYLLDLLGVFVADEDNYWINVNTVEPFDGVRGNVEQTVTALHPKTRTKHDFNRQTELINCFKSYDKHYNQPNYCS